MAKRTKERLSRKQRFLFRQAQKDRLEKVRLLVEKHLERYQPKDCRLVTFPGIVMEHGGRWYVQVEPDRQSVGLGDYTDQILKTEDDIVRIEGFDVMLVSMLPMDDELEFEMPVLWALQDSCRDRATSKSS